MVGDRGGIVTRFVEADGSDPGDPEIVSHTSQGPLGISIEGVDSGETEAVLNPFVAHPLDRRVSLSHDRDGTEFASFGGHEAGGDDGMRGGPGHDSLHGADGDDYVNGDSGGDYVYGDDGADVLWGGRGNPDDAHRNDPGPDGEWSTSCSAATGRRRRRRAPTSSTTSPVPGVSPTRRGRS